MFIQSLNIKPYSNNVNKISFKHKDITQDNIQKEASDVRPIDAEVSDAIKAQIPIGEKNNSRNLALQALRLKYNSSKILRQAKGILSDAQKSYDEAMKIGRQGQKQGFQRIYENGLLKAAFDFEWDEKNDCLKEGFLRIKEYDASRNIIRSTITHDSTESWTIHQATSEYDKEDTFRILDFKVSDVYKGAKPNEKGLYDIDEAIFEDEEGIVVYKGVKDIKSLDDYKAQYVEEFFKFDKEGNITDFASGINGSGSIMTAKKYCAFNKDNSIILVENCNCPDEITYEFTDTANNCRIYTRQ